jgi:hypothetical protein
MMRPLLAYVTTLCDPLTNLVRRLEVERAAAAELVADPVRSSLFLATMIRPFVQALPPGDPWRSVAVRLPDGRAYPPSATVPDTPGAVNGEQGPFGTVQDHLDLVPRGAEDLSDDLALAGLAQPLPLPSSHLVAIAGHGSTADLAVTIFETLTLTPESGGFELPASWAQLVPGPGGVGIFLAGEALRRVLTRYRTYTGDSAVSAETPQLAYELDFWAADLTVPDGEPTATMVRSVAGTAPDPVPGLRSDPIPDDSYESFRLS